MDRYQGVDIEWRDVTAFLPQAARDIPVGKLVHTGWFTLREAVAAIEVMDPKMDTGRVSDADAADPFVSVEDRIERGFVPVDGISDDDLIDIFDDILAAEMAFLYGEPLSQTLGSCLYLHRPSLIIDPRLQHYVLSVHRCAAASLTLASSAGVFREEDFCPDVTDFLLANPPDATLPAIASALFYYAERETTSPLLFSRLRVRGLLSHLFNLLSIPTPSHDDILDDIAALRTAMAIAYADVVTEKQPRVGFDDRVTKRTAATYAFPRATAEWTRRRGADALERLLSEIERAIDLLKVTSVNDLLNALELFSIFGDDVTPSAVTRSFVYASLFPDGALSLHGTPAHVDIQNHLAHFSRATWPESSIPSVTSFLSSLDRAGSPLADLVGALLLNRARFHRRLRYLLVDFESLQLAADSIDAITPPSHWSASPFSTHLQSFVYLLKLRVMRYWLLLGFELDLFSNHDALIALWYLDYVIGSELQHRNAISAHVAKVEEADAAAAARPIGAQISKRKQKIAARAAAVLGHVDETPAPPPPRESHETTWLVAMQHLVRGVLRFLAALRCAGIVSTWSPSSMSDGHVAFHRRFAPLLSVTSPTPLSFAQFEDNFPPTPPLAGRSRAREVLRGAHESLQSAKAAYERLSRAVNDGPRGVSVQYRAVLAGMTRTAVANGVNVALAQRVIGADKQDETDKKDKKDDKKDDGKDKKKKESVKVETKFVKWVPVVTLVVTEL